jgi:putative membrane-bound dehydrogenase-like protein
MLNSRLSLGRKAALFVTLTVCGMTSLSVQAAKKRPSATDSAPVYASPAMNVHVQRLQEVSADIKDAKQLYLVVSEEGDFECDWANWLEPTLVMADGSTKDLTEIKWRAANAGFGNVQLGKNVQGGPLAVEGKTFTKGIGTHAKSTIVYDLPAGAEKFTAKVAIDDGGAARDGKPTAASVRFIVYTREPVKAGSGTGFVPEDLFSIGDENLEISIWATTPMLKNPTNIDFDIHGRMYVAEGINYRHAASRRPEGDRIVVLTDSDGDGEADKTSVFVQEPNLAAPLGVAVLDDKVIVSHSPDLIVYTDANRDGKFDSSTEKREVLLTGFAGKQHDHSLHSLTAGPNGQWYFNQGNTGGEFTDKSGKTFRIGSPYMMQEIAGKTSDDGNVWIGGFTVRMNPDGTHARIMGHNYRNSYEQTVTSFGDLFQNDNDDPPACRVAEIIEGGNAGFASADGKRTWEADKRPGQDTPTAEWRQEDPGTMPSGDVYGGGSPTGVAYYENGALGDKWQGLLLTCEAGKNVVFGYLPKPEGAGFKLERLNFLTSNKEGEYAGSDFKGGPNNELKTRFRPSDVCIGPDGAIYVADWFDPRVGGHGTNDDDGHGTIYRIAPKGFKSVVPKIDLTTTEGQITALKSPAVNVRNSGFTRLKTQGEKAVPALSALLKDPNPYIAARAIWLLAQVGPKGQEIVSGMLNSKDEHQRLVATRALRFAGVDPVKLATKMVSDPSAAVRREVALSMREVPAEQSVPVLVKIAAQFDGKDRSYLEAFGLGSTGKEAQVYQAARKEVNASAASWSEAFAWIAWRLHTPEAVNDFKTRALSSKLAAPQTKLMVNALAFVNSPTAAGAMAQLATSKDFVHKDLANWWINNRKGNLWRSYDVDGILKALGQDPQSIKIVAVEMPAEPANTPKLPPAAEIAKLPGDVARGKTAIAACYMCHKVEDQGVGFGPDLTSFGKQQPTDVIVDAIVNPSTEISHGFAGSEIRTRDGLIITGMVLSNGDPIIIKCMGGQTQTIPKASIASMKPMTKSLMYSPSLLGLTPQSIADMTAYLKSL